MTNLELEKWHHEEFWPAYKKFLFTPDPKTKWKPGAPGASEAKVLKLKPSKELREKIINKLELMTKHRQDLFDLLGFKEYHSYTSEMATGGEEIYKNRLATTWWNNRLWNTEIPDLPEVSKKWTVTASPPKAKCCIPGCNNDVHGPAYDKCTQHHADSFMKL